MEPTMQDCLTISALPAEPVHVLYAPQEPAPAPKPVAIGMVLDARHASRVLMGLKMIATQMERTFGSAGGSRAALELIDGLEKAFETAGMSYDPNADHFTTSFFGAEGGQA